ncbi:hypothetical protein ANO11243_070850 [Dothideomycetidae sp. 11243]|nr:hypothetical protein ANO11243_070850 [fungal sp. No.11243]
MAAASTPRITAPYLQQFQHQTVRILGKVSQLRGDQAMLDAGGQITLLLNRVDHAVEVIGKVDKDLQVRVLVATDFGTNIGTIAHR